MPEGSFLGDEVAPDRVHLVEHLRLGRPGDAGGGDAIVGNRLAMGFGLGLLQKEGATHESGHKAPFLKSRSRCRHRVTHVRGIDAYVTPAYVTAPTRSSSLVVLVM